MSTRLGGDPPESSWATSSQVGDGLLQQRRLRVDVYGHADDPAFHRARDAAKVHLRDPFGPLLRVFFFQRSGGGTAGSGATHHDASTGRAPRFLCSARVYLEELVQPKGTGGTPQRQRPACEAELIYVFSQGRAEGHHPGGDHSYTVAQALEAFAMYAALSLLALGRDALQLRSRGGNRDGSHRTVTAVGGRDRRPTGDVSPPLSGLLLVTDLPPPRHEDQEEEGPGDEARSRRRRVTASIIPLFHEAARRVTYVVVDWRHRRHVVIDPLYHHSCCSSGHDDPTRKRGSVEKGEEIGGINGARRAEEPPTFVADLCQLLASHFHSEGNRCTDRARSPPPFCDIIAVGDFFPATVTAPPHVVLTHIARDCLGGHLNLVVSSVGDAITTITSPLSCDSDAALMTCGRFRLQRETLPFSISSTSSSCGTTRPPALWHLSFNEHYDPTATGITMGSRDVMATRRHSRAIFSGDLFAADGNVGRRLQDPRAFGALMRRLIAPLTKWWAASSQCGRGDDANDEDGGNRRRSGDDDGTEPRRPQMPHPIEATGCPPTVAAGASMAASVVVVSNTTLVLPSYGGYQHITWQESRHWFADLFGVVREGGPRTFMRHVQEVWDRHLADEARGSPVERVSIRSDEGQVEGVVSHGDAGSSQSLARSHRRGPLDGCRSSAANVFETVAAGALSERGQRHLIRGERSGSGSGTSAGSPRYRGGGRLVTIAEDDEPRSRRVIASRTLDGSSSPALSLGPSLSDVVYALNAAAAGEDPPLPRSPPLIRRFTEALELAMAKVTSSWSVVAQSLVATPHPPPPPPLSNARATGPPPPQCGATASAAVVRRFTEAWLQPTTSPGSVSEATSDGSLRWSAIMLLDVRSVQAYQRCHVPGSVNVPMVASSSSRDDSLPGLSLRQQKKADLWLQRLIVPGQAIGIIVPPCAAVEAQEGEFETGGGVGSAARCLSRLLILGVQPDDVAFVLIDVSERPEKHGQHRQASSVSRLRDACLADDETGRRGSSSTVRASLDRIALGRLRRFDECESMLLGTHDGPHNDGAGGAVPRTGASNAVGDASMTRRVGVLDCRTSLEYRNGTLREAFFAPLSGLRAFLINMAEAGGADDGHNFLSDWLRRDVDSSAMMPPTVVVASAGTSPTRGRGAASAAEDTDRPPPLAVVTFCAAGYRSQIFNTMLAAALLACELRRSDDEPLETTTGAPSAVSKERWRIVDVEGGALQLLKEHAHHWIVKDRDVLCVS